MSVAKNIPLLFACVVVLAMQITTSLAQSNQEDFLAGHNAARAAVGVPDISWNTTVEAYAQNYANLRQADCSLTHSPDGRPYGENIYGGVSGSTAWNATDAVKGWVDEKIYYDYNTNTCSSPGTDNCMHYTQVVWKNSTQLGCARVVCDNNVGVFIICSYYPPGNWNGEKPY